MIASEEPWAAVKAPITGDALKKTAGQPAAAAVHPPEPKVKQHKFANGDKYIGGWQKGLPEGEGKYDWSDGSSYEGGWKAGAKHGVGHYIWNSGASYQGEWQNGCMHGVGAFEAPDGSRYQGGWKDDLKHGLGKKVYANGDIYEGLWAQGKPDGPGRYIWVDYNEYDGEWRQGRMSGQGTFVWKTGERYDGEWKDGQEDGVGVFTFRDGATYSGFWHSGKKHGVGIYRPPVPGMKSSSAASPSKSTSRTWSAAGGNRQALADPAAAAAALPDEAADEYIQQPRAGQNGRSSVQQAGNNAAAAQAAAEQPAAEQKGQPQQPSQQPQQPQPPADSILVKEYREGKLVRQFPVKPQTLSHVYSTFDGPAAVRTGSSAASTSSSKHILVTSLGEVVYKERSAYDLLQQLQLGIRWSVASKALQDNPITSDLGNLEADDFTATPKQEFSRSGSKWTPVHAAEDFVWKDYAPTVFRYLRHLAGIHASEYVASLCSDQSLRLLTCPGGRSGAIFYATADERYIVKTVTKSEARLLMQLLPAYIQHIVQQPESLVTKFLGLHRLEAMQGSRKRVRFVVMSNILCTGLAIHKRFDLKGSTAGRSTPAEVAQANSQLMLKDLDLHHCYKLPDVVGGRLKAQIMADTAFLSGAGVMDYSLLLGVHQKHPQQQQQAGEGRNFTLHDPEPDLAAAVSKLQEYLPTLQLDQRLSADFVELAKSRILTGHVMSAHNRKLTSQTRSPAVLLSTRPLRNPALNKAAKPLPSGPDQQPDIAVLGQHELAVAVPLGAASKQVLTNESSDDLNSQPQAQPVVLYFGITDLLQSYTFTKRLESAAKRLTAPAASISAVAPKYYAARFRKFMAQVFA